MLTPDLRRAAPLCRTSDAHGYLARICFKTGPPTYTGVELEWTVHDRSDPTRPVDRTRLGEALREHAPATLDPAGPHLPLGGSGTVTVEPGGQVEISTVAEPDLDTLWHRTTADIGQLTGLLADAGLTLGGTGIDPHRSPRPVVQTPRYRAMRCAFDRRSRAGRTMMYSTAGLQVCLDAGEPDQITSRWAAAHALGPVLLATFATSRRHAGRDTGWASARMAAWLDIDPAWTGPVWSAPDGDADPVAAWSAYALGAPLLCRRRDGDDWSVPPGITFQDWIDGALPRPPTTDDLDYHLSTLFPPVRPRGYLEIRYLDGQPAGEWIAPVAVLAVLIDDPQARELARETCEPVADRWRTAARCGLADPVLARAARRTIEVALRALDRRELSPALRAEVNRIVRQRLAAAEGAS